MEITGTLFFKQSNYDGYTNSLYTITVAAVETSNGAHPPYSEECSANLISMYSGGKHHPGIVFIF
jgi:kexin